MAGVGIRYVEMTRQLCAASIDVTLFAPGVDEEAAALPGNGRCAMYSDALPLCMDAAYDAVVVQGHLAAKVLPAVRTTPVAVDLYDPALLESLSRAQAMESGIYDSNLELLRASCRRGDFFLCANERQRDFYLGCLAALGRMPPERIAADPDVRGLIDVVPFGVPDPMPPHRPYLPAAGRGVKRLLFGGLYDWYDPWIVIEALAEPALRDCRLLVVDGPNPGPTSQRLMTQLRSWCRDHPRAARQVEFLDWAPCDRRFDLLRDVDLLVAPHRDTIESRFSMRTRFVEAIAAGCPVIATRAGEAAELVVRYGAGAVIPQGDAAALTAAIKGLLEPAKRPAPDARVDFVADFNWKRVLSPLVAFCANPAVDRFRARVPEPVQAATTLPARRRKAVSFSVLIPTFNRMDALPRVVEALRGQHQAPDFELIVVDDGSTDGTVDWLRRQDPGVPMKVIRQQNLGPAGARNTAIQNAGNEYLAFLGDDIIPDRFWLSAHARRHALHEGDADVAVVGHTDWHPEVRRTRFLAHLDGTGWQFGYDRIRDIDDAPFNFLYSSNLSLKRELVLHDSFDTRLYRAWEDTELGYRLKCRGARLAYEPGARAAHLHQSGVLRMAARHRRNGYVAVEFCRLHPELEAFLLPSRRTLASASGPVARTLRKWYAAALERLPVDLPGTWDRMLRDHYAAGIEDYMIEHGLHEIPELRQRRIFPVTFYANSPLLSHGTGASEGRAWVCMPGKDRAGHCVFGPGFSVDHDDAYEVRYFIQGSGNDGKPGRCATLDVYDQAADRVIAAAPVNGTELPGAPGCIVMPFSGKTGQRLEFRIFWHGTRRLDIDRIELTRAASGR